MSEHSVFGAIETARSVEARPCDAPERFEPPPAAVSLRGEWQRLVLPSDPPDLPAGLPPPGAHDWHPVMVPNCAGGEPSLSAHFGPVFYARRLGAVAPGPLRLVFDSVDYLCDAWLDGAWLGRHEGYFAPFAFDVTGRVFSGSRLVVRVQDPFEDLDPTAPFVRHPKRVIKGTLKYHDSRPGGLPGRHTPGWTPREGQSLSSGGITGDVRLAPSGPVRLDAVFATPLDPQAGSVHLATLLSNLDRAPREAVVVFDLAAPDAARRRVALAVTLPAGAARLDAELVIADPVPWWPASHADLGPPALYRLEVTALADGRASDARTACFGLRTARIAGDPKRLIVNGRDCFVHAVNYIPTQHFADVSEDFYARDMQLCRAANLGSLGVHGHLQPQACYDAADRAGMLVFQDFPLQWHYDAGDESNPGFRERACRQIAEMAYTFWNHPSIVYWACHNEPTRLFVPGMQPDARFDFDNQVLDAALAQRLRSVDPVRHVHEASGIGDDLHVYDGSLDGGSVYGVRARKAWFVSEYGFWTPGPGVTRWGDQGWPPDEEQVRAWLSRLSFGAWTFAFAGLPERYGSLDAWRRATEAYGAYLAKVQTEWFRIRRGDPFFALRWHFLVDWWGWAGGGLVDVDRRPKATYRALAEALRPLLVATSLPSSVAAPGAPLEFEIVAVNETRAPARLSVRWSWHETQRSLVIGSDDEAERRWEIRPPSAGSMVALPEAGAFPPPCESTSLADGRLEAEIGPEAAAPIGRVRVTAPTRALAGGTLQLAWAGEHNWFHVLSAEPGWFPGPGAFLVGPGLHERYP